MLRNEHGCVDYTKHLLDTLLAARVGRGPTFGGVWRMVTGIKSSLASAKSEAVADPRPRTARSECIRGGEREFGRHAALRRTPFSHAPSVRIAVRIPWPVNCARSMKKGNHRTGIALHCIALHIWTLAAAPRYKLALRRRRNSASGPISIRVNGAVILCSTQLSFWWAKAHSKERTLMNPNDRSRAAAIHT